MKRLIRNRRAISAVEFGLASPVIFAIMLGGLEMGHTMWAKATLDGEVQKAGRDLALEDAGNTTRREEIMERARKEVKKIIATADVEFTTTAYHDYRDARDREEEYNDANHNGSCDHHELYVDANNNGQWDADSGVDGAGGAKDVMLLTATATYPRLALSRIWSDSNTVVLTSKTMLRNQPSADQEAAPERNCPW